MPCSAQVTRRIPGNKVAALGNMLNSALEGLIPGALVLNQGFK